ncbi:MAG: hypothetical protein U0996_24715 [Planctomycetaceae bacterium]
MRKMTLPFALLLAGALQGCSAGPQFFGHRDQTSRHEPGSDAWWAEKAALPPGVRQECKKGKVWPARPRSTQEPQQFIHTYHSAHYWPLPYTCQDAQAVWANIDQQTALGWQEETTIYDRHFDPMTQQLTKAGELHLTYILHAVPAERRAVYIQSTYDAALDALRTESVNATMAKMNYNNSVTVTVRDCQEVGRPAAEVQMINQMYRDTTPTPRLGDAGSGSGGSSSGSEGSGG